MAATAKKQKTEQKPVMSAQHTPGPWEVVALNGFGPYAIRMPTPAGSKHPTHYGVGQIGTEANARLIAAAPELLEALIELEAAATEASATNVAARILSAAIHRARAAIAKAEGR